MTANFFQLHSVKLKEYNDIELVNRYKQTGDKSAVGILFERYTHLVFGVCMKYLKDEEESKDAVMQVFEKLMNDLHRHEVQQFKGWLYSVAKNYCLMQLRSERTELKKEELLKKDTAALVENDQELHLNHNNDKELQLNKLEESVKQLNNEQRICIELFYLKEKCYQEIADTTGYSLMQVKSHIQNGKRNLKILMTTGK